MHEGYSTSQDWLYALVSAIYHRFSYAARMIDSLIACNYQDNGSVTSSSSSDSEVDYITEIRYTKWILLPVSVIVPARGMSRVAMKSSSKDTSSSSKDTCFNCVESMISGVVFKAVQSTHDTLDAYLLIWNSTDHSTIIPAGTTVGYVA